MATHERVYRRSGAPHMPHRRQESSSSSPGQSSTSSGSSTSSSSSSSSSSSASSASSTSSSASSTSSTSSSISTSSGESSSTTSSDSSTSLSSSSSSTTNTSVSRVTRVSTRPDGGIVTVTSTVEVPPEPTDTNSNDNGGGGGGGGGFFQNKAAMGATFAVAGIAALVIFFFLVTTYLRKRRAMKFDRDVAAAAAAAAAESQAVRPFDDDDDEVFPGARRQAAGYGYGPGKMAEHDPYGYAAAAVVGGGPGGYGRTAQAMRQQQTGSPALFSPSQQYPQTYNQPYNGGVFGRQAGADAYNMQELGPGGGAGGGPPSAWNDPADYPPRPGSAGTGHGTLPGVAGIGSQNTNIAGAGAGGNGFSALVGAAGLGAGAGAAAAYRNQQEDPYGGYVGSPTGDSRYPQPGWSQPQQQYAQPNPPEPQNQGWYNQYGQPAAQRAASPPPRSGPTPAPAYYSSPGASSGGNLTAQGYPNEKSTYSLSGNTNTPSAEGPSTASGHTAVSSASPTTPPQYTHVKDFDGDVGSVLEGHGGKGRVLKVANE